MEPWCRIGVAFGWLRAAFIIHHSSSCIRLMVPSSALAPPKQCLSCKHVSSMFLGCSLLVPGFPLLSFPRPIHNAPPPPLGHNLQTPEALPRLHRASNRFRHQQMPTADSSRFGLHPRRAPLKPTTPARILLVFPRPCLSSAAANGPRIQTALLPGSPAPAGAVFLSA